MKKRDRLTAGLLTDDLVPGLLSGVDAAAKGLDIPITHLQVLRCQTGRRVLIRSGTVKDDGLVLLQPGSRDLNSFRETAPSSIMVPHAFSSA